MTAITVPVTYNNNKWKQYKSSALKAMAGLDQANFLYHAQNGEAAECGYFYKAGNSANVHTDCTKLYEFYTKVMNVQKVCDSNAYSNGCIPEYKTGHGNSGCNGFSVASILAGKAFITTDGMIYIPYYGFSLPIMAVDLNGFKGPNKWGYDIHVFILEIRNNSLQYFPLSTGCAIVEKGGISTLSLLKK